jgi:acylaminoacyl-peptidase
MSDSNSHILDTIQNVMYLAASPISGWILNNTSAIVKYYTCDPISTSYREIYHTYGAVSMPIVSGSIVTYTPSRQLFAVFREGSRQETILEIWRENRLTSVKLLEQHKQIITNSALGYFTWSSDETLLAYVAENADQPAGSFWSKSAGAGKEHYIKQNFGENMLNISDPRIFIYNIQTQTLETFEPPCDVYTAQPVFRPRSRKLVFVGYAKHPYAIGLQYMLNKETKLFEYDIETKEISEIKLTEDVYAACMPRFTPDGRFMSYFGAPKGSTTHAMSMYLNLMDYEDKSTRVLLSPVREFNPTFNGINTYHDILVKSDWLNNSTFAFSTINKLNEEVYLIDLSSNLTLLPSNLPNPSYSTILDIFQDSILTYSSSINTPYIITLTTLSSSLSSQILSSGTLHPISPLQQSICNTLSSLSVRTFPLSTSPHENILYYSDPANPLIVFIHGGPHFYAYLPFSITRAAMMSLGYNILMVNYRGSLGYGQDLVEVLRGKMATIEIDDVIEAIEKAGEFVSVKEVISYGWSYGGLISSFLAARGKVNYAVVLNGLVDLVSTLYTSDIAGMILATALNSEVVHALEEEKLLELYRRSPVSEAYKIKVPVFLMGGAKDVRVPSYGTIEMFRILKGNGVDVTGVWYDNEGHDVAGPAAFFDLLAKVLCWLKEKRSIT